MILQLVAGRRDAARNVTSVTDYSSNPGRGYLEKEGKGLAWLWGSI